MINVNSQCCKEKFYRSLKRHLEEIDKKYDEVCIACIGTDRSTGDSLGPLVGHKLNGIEEVRVIGNLNNPLHAKNLEHFVATINENTLVIAIDASLGKEEYVGSINIKQGPVKPGSGVGKKLPRIGDIAITGVVNVGGFMEYAVLQNTRLSLVMKIADVISDGIKKTFQPPTEKVKTKSY